MEEHAEKLRAIYEDVTPLVWSLFADGHWWETVEPYYQGCPYCAEKAFETLSKMNKGRDVIDTLHGIAYGFSSTDSWITGRYVTVFKTNICGNWRTYTALLSDEGLRRVRAHDNTVVLLVMRIGEDISADATVRCYANTLIRELRRLEKAGGDDE